MHLLKYYKVETYMGKKAVPHNK